jgi:hypothetical protein
MVDLAMIPFVLIALPVVTALVVGIASARTSSGPGGSEVTFELGTPALAGLAGVTLTSGYISIQNLSTVIPLSAFAFLVLLLLVHRALWPVLQRPLYAVARTGLLRRRKASFAAGIGLLAFAFPSLSIRILESILGLIS